ncbi:MAG: carboxypeptidase-like regulatory domain-containing protein [Bernardetiaceae bacterium]|nr:carboxypeptidase-like regulatory domain-containing protein [Bernardetiaceae bacterium]
MPEPRIQIGVRVLNRITNQPVSGATVRLYDSREEFLADQNVRYTATTDRSGLAVFEDVPPNRISLVVSAESGQLNNWSNKTEFLFDPTSAAVFTFETKIEEVPFANVLSGRGNKVWRRNYVQINNTRNTDCSARLERNFSLQRPDSASVTMILNDAGSQGCPGAGQLLASASWRPSDDRTSLLIGLGSSIRNQRRMVILELSDRRLRLQEILSGATVLEEYQLVQ